MGADKTGSMIELVVKGDVAKRIYSSFKTYREQAGGCLV